MAIRDIHVSNAKAIRKALIADLTKTKYFKFRNGTFPITPEDQATSPLSAVPMAGKSLYLTTVTMKSTTLKFVAVSFNSVKPSVSHRETTGIKVRNHRY